MVKEKGKSSRRGLRVQRSCGEAVLGAIVGVRYADRIGANNETEVMKAGVWLKKADPEGLEDYLEVSGFHQARGTKSCVIVHGKARTTDRASTCVTCSVQKRPEVKC